MYYITVLEKLRGTARRKNVAMDVGALLKQTRVNPGVYIRHVPYTAYICTTVVFGFTILYRHVLYTSIEEAPGCQKECRHGR